MQRASFVVAYFLDAATQADMRPTFRTDPLDRAERPEYAPYSIASSNGIDVAALAGLSRQHARVDDAQRVRLMDAVFEPHVRSNMRECCDPHHIFVFYTQWGQPVATIEVGLTCRAARIWPIIEESGRLSYAVNFLGIARLLEDLRLPLGPVAFDFEGYEKSITDDQPYIEAREARVAELRREEQAEKEARKAKKKK